VVAFAVPSAVASKVAAAVNAEEVIEVFGVMAEAVVAAIVDTEVAVAVVAVVVAAAVAAGAQVDVEIVRAVADVEVLDEIATAMVVTRQYAEYIAKKGAAMAFVVAAMVAVAWQLL